MGDEEQSPDGTTTNYTTIIILVSGVFGGLGLIIVLILCFKHCIKRPPQTGLDVEEYEEEKLPMSASSVVSPKSYRTTKTELTPLHEQRMESLSMADVKDMSLTLPAMSDDKSSNNGWNDLIITDNIDYYDRFYPEGQNMKVASKQFHLKRNSVPSLNGAQSRSPSTRCSSTGGNYGRHRTLHSSEESGFDTDNAPDITVINSSMNDLRVKEAAVCTGSTDEQRSQIKEAASFSNSIHLVPCRPVPKRRQSTHLELPRQPRERFERQIKSQDDTKSVYKLQRDAKIDCNDNESFHSYSDEQADQIREKDKNRQFHLPVKQRSLTLPRMNTEERERSDSLEVYLQPHTHDTADLDNQSVTSRNSNQSWRQLWQLRSMLEEDNTGADVGSTSEELRQAMALSDDWCGREGSGSSRELICNVVYTSYESENFVHDVESERSVTAGERQLSGENFLHPPDETYSSRRRNFQQQRGTIAGRVDIECNSSTEKSFDSFETATTDGTKSSESSRVQVTTTSFESSTTDSDSHIRRQRRVSFKSDSGYKSLETQYHKKEILTRQHPQPAIINVHPRTASRRRRDFQSRNEGLMRHEITTSCSSHELDTSPTNQTQTDSFAEGGSTADNFVNGKRHFLNRILRYSKGNKQRLSQRDYSIDEKSDALFREFNRYEPMLDKFNGSNNLPASAIRADVSWQQGLKARVEKLH